MDDSTEWEVCSPSALDSQIQQTATEAVEWHGKNIVCVSCDKTKELLVFLWCISPDIPAITIKEKTIERVTSTKWLGVIISNDDPWQAPQRLCLLKPAGVECIHIVRI